jgi:hypothetical protein
MSVIISKLIVFSVRLEQNFEIYFRLKSVFKGIYIKVLVTIKSCG